MSRPGRSARLHGERVDGLTSKTNRFVQRIVELTADGYSQRCTPQMQVRAKWILQAIQPLLGKHKYNSRRKARAVACAGIPAGAACNVLFAAEHNSGGKVPPCATGGSPPVMGRLNCRLPGITDWQASLDRVTGIPVHPDCNDKLQPAWEVRLTAHTEGVTRAPRISLF